MPRLIRLVGAEMVDAADPFTAVDDDQPTPRGDVIITLARFEREGERLLAEGRAVGVRVAPDEDVVSLDFDAAGVRIRHV